MVERLEAPVGARVLVVDDHPGFRAAARRLLEKAGYVVVGEAEDGLTALDAARTLRPNLVLLDIRLPDMDGFDVCARLTAQPRPPAVVLTSSSDALEFGERVAASSALGFVSKQRLTATALAELVGMM